MHLNEHGRPLRQERTVRLHAGLVQGKRRSAGGGRENSTARHQHVSLSLKS
jgi:hypothetical protein